MIQPIEPFATVSQSSNGRNCFKSLWQTVRSFFERIANCFQSLFHPRKSRLQEIELQVIAPSNFKEVSSVADVLPPISVETSQIKSEQILNILSVEFRSIGKDQARKFGENIVLENGSPLVLDKDDFYVEVQIEGDFTLDLLPVSLFKQGMTDSGHLIFFFKGKRYDLIPDPVFFHKEILEDAKCADCYTYLREYCKNTIRLVSNPFRYNEDIPDTYSNWEALTDKTVEIRDGRVIPFDRETLPHVSMNCLKPKFTVTVNENNLTINIVIADFTIDPEEDKITVLFDDFFLYFYCERKNPLYLRLDFSNKGYFLSFHESSVHQKDGLYTIVIPTKSVEK